MTSGDTSQLDQARYLSLATFRKSGKEVRTPVWFAPTGGAYYIFTAASSGKVKRLRNSSRARIAPCGAFGAIQGRWQEAQVSFLAPGSTEQRQAHQALRSRYGWQMKLLDFGSWLGRRISARAWLKAELSK